MECVSCSSCTSAAETLRLRGQRQHLDLPQPGRAAPAASASGSARTDWLRLFLLLPGTACQHCHARPFIQDPCERELPIGQLPLVRPRFLRSPSRRTDLLIREFDLIPGDLVLAPSTLTSSPRVTVNLFWPSSLSPTSPIRALQGEGSFGNSTTSAALASTAFISLRTASNSCRYAAACAGGPLLVELYHPFEQPFGFGVFSPSLEVEGANKDQGGSRATCPHPWRSPALSSNGQRRPILAGAGTLPPT